MSRHSSYLFVNVVIALVAIVGMLNIVQGARVHSLFYWVAAIDFALAAGLYYKVYIHDKA